MAFAALPKLEEIVSKKRSANISQQSTNRILISSMRMTDAEIRAKMAKKKGYNLLC